MSKMSADFRGREPRIAVSFEATLIESDGCIIPISVLDVSSSGFRISSSAELVVGEEVQLKLPRSGPLRATICWTRGEQAGGIFLDAPTTP